MSKNDKNFKKPGKNSQNIEKPSKMSKNLRENRQKYRKNFKNVEKL